MLKGCSVSEWRILDSLAPYAIPGLGAFDLRDAQYSQEVIDRDDYGRVMYRFYSNYDSYDLYDSHDPNRAYGSRKTVFNGQAIIICQKVTRNSFYYYTDVCCLMSENDFDETKVEELKNKNDWNRPLDESKMKKQKVSDGPYVKIYNVPRETIEKSEEKVIKELGIKSEQLIMFFEDDVDLNNKIMYCAVVVREDSDKEYYFVIMDTDYKPAFMKFENLYEVEEPLSDFKKENGWNN